MKIDVPMCAVHRRNERLARWLAGSGVVGLGLAISTAFGLAGEGPLWPPGVLLIGAGLGLFLLRVAGFLHLRTWCGWRALGLRTAELSGDLLHLTIHTRSVALRRELLQLRPVK